MYVRASMYVRAYIVPAICEPLVRPPTSVVQNEYDHLKGCHSRIIQINLRTFKF